MVAFPDAGELCGATPMILRMAPGRQARCGFFSLAAATLWAGSAHGVISTVHDPDPPAPQIINEIVGADRFYHAGFFGNSTVIANVEAGHVWDGHETLGHVDTFLNDPSIEGPVRQYDFHATAVGFAINGLGPPAPGGGYYWYQFGMAPATFMASTAIATDFGSDGSFSVSGQSFLYGYQTTMQDGVPVPIFPGIYVSVPADVVNSSWGFSDPDGSHPFTLALDALAFANGTTVTLPSGNRNGGDPSGPVVGMGSGYNSITVASVGSDISNPPYDFVSDFSLAGPNNFYNPATGAVVPGARAAVDIAAPGEALLLAAYTGTTGANTGGTDPWEPAPGEPDLRPTLYYNGIDGTSFSSAIVAGGAALVVDAGYDTFGGGEAVDGRVVKAVLMNSASKPAGWDNGMTVTNGVQSTTRGLDYQTGAGLLNLDKAFDQYMGGTAGLAGTEGGDVEKFGWDLGLVSDADALNEYRIIDPLAAGGVFVATLDWFVNRSLDGGVDPIDDVPNASDVQFDNLDLELWHLAYSGPDTLVASSETLFGNVEHIHATLPFDGDYALRVVWRGEIYDVPGDTANNDYYGLSWYIPEPGGCLASLAIAIGSLISIRRRGRPMAHGREPSAA